MEDTSVFPAPVFEGSEKRIELSFDLCAAPSDGLRSLSRAQLDAICTAAHCCIVSSRSNAFFDAYVLSESSLFVYPHKLVLKTCGTTRLLDAVPLILDLAGGIGAVPSKCRYTRASFLFPEHQPAPHSSFKDETAYLQRYFGSFTGGAGAYVMGDALNGLQWHVYVAGNGVSPMTVKPCYTLEVCMTGLCSNKARQFFRTHHDVPAARVTAESGIGGIVPGAEVDDYVFDPCGYSMNGIEDEGFITVHITPEDGFSYASVELCGFSPAALGSTHKLVSKVVEVFGAREVSVSLSLDAGQDHAWAESFSLPHGYDISSTSLQDLRSGGYVAYFTLNANSDAKIDYPGSPRSVLKKLPSFATLAAALGSGSSAAPSSGGPSSSAGGDSDTDLSCDFAMACTLAHPAAGAGAAPAGGAAKAATAEVAHA